MGRPGCADATRCPSIDRSRCRRPPERGTWCGWADIAMPRDEAVLHCGSFAKWPSAFFWMSRSMVTRRSSRCNRSPSMTASGRNGRFDRRSSTPSRSWATHRLSTRVGIPRSRAKCVAVAPGCLHSFTASLLNSSAKLLRACRKATVPLVLKSQEFGGDVNIPNTSSVVSKKLGEAQGESDSVVQEIVHALRQAHRVAVDHRRCLRKRLLSQAPSQNR